MDIKDQLCPFLLTFTLRMGFDFNFIANPVIDHAIFQKTASVASKGWWWRLIIFSQNKEAHKTVLACIT